MKAEELKQKIASGDVMEIIDVREKEEFDNGIKIKGAKNIPMGQMFVDASMGKLLKDKKIVAVCKSGARCEIVARELSKKGFDIDFLEGGMGAW